MIIFHNKEALKRQLEVYRSRKDSIGLVPTMGALHEGHLSLINESKKQNDVTVATIFVNPTQFDNLEDLEKYPQTIESDLNLLLEAGCDIVFTPSVSEIYQENVNAKPFDFDGLEHEMEGKFRPGHFNGVGTIVKELFLIVQPNFAYFGEKDFQQLQIIRKLVEKERFSITIVGCPIYREDDGLAMSSRNMRLSSTKRKEAPFIFKTLKEAKKQFKTESIKTISNFVTKAFQTNKSLDLEYFFIADENSLKPADTKEISNKYRAFIAVFAGNIRLIDNIKLN